MTGFNAVLNQLFIERARFWTEWYAHAAIHPAHDTRLTSRPYMIQTYYIDDEIAFITRLEQERISREIGGTDDH